MRADLLQPLQIVTEFGVDGVRQNLAVLAVDNVALPVQEPCWDLELRGVLDDGDDALELVRVEVSGPSRNRTRLSLANPSLEDRPAAHRLFRSTSAFLQTMLA